MTVDSSPLGRGPTDTEALSDTTLMFKGLHVKLYAGTPYDGVVSPEPDVWKTAHGESACYVGWNVSV